MSLLGPLVFALAVSADGASAVRVSASDRGLAVRAQGASLSAVLEEIGRQSGTKVTYDGTAPSVRLTCDFVASTAGEAFTRAMEGLSLNYVLYGGTPDVPRILLISGQGAAVPTSAAAVATGHGPLPVTELALEEPDPPGEVTANLAAPPEGGAAPARLRRGREGEGSDAGGAHTSPPISALANELVEKVIPPPPPVEPGEFARNRGGGRRAH
jgi:hypothetical protein